jgi:hypothetical protein
VGNVGLNYEGEQFAKRMKEKKKKGGILYAIFIVNQE